jgi:2-keto-4-pentenoate hydratase/2-oxohepta-3-ene-1,7-dioic acid hydratase in catechol pathway
MKLFRFNLENTPSIVALRSDGSAAFMGSDMLELIREGLPAARQRYADATLFKHSGTAPFAEMTPLTPLPNPGKIIAVGQNYMDHIREQKGTPPKYPLLFSKFTSSIINPGDTIRWSPTLTNEVDFEAELVVIIGKTARYVSEETALDYVFGYTAANDVSARDLQRNDGQWTRAKGLETFCPLGPAIVTADEIPDPQNVWIKTTLNGQVVQNSNTKEMIFGVKHLIAHISQAFTLHPGDMILTGTPDGVGAFRNPKLFMKSGDEVVVELEKIGVLRNTCQEETR